MLMDVDKMQFYKCKWVVCYGWKGKFV